MVSHGFTQNRRASQTLARLAMKCQRTAMGEMGEAQKRLENACILMLNIIFAQTLPILFDH